MAEQTKAVDVLKIMCEDAHEAMYERERVSGIKAAREAIADSDAARLAVAELVESVAALVDPPLRYNDSRIEIDCSDHATAMAVVGRVRRAIAAVRGGA